MKKVIAMISAIAFAATGMVLWQLHPQSMILSAEEPEYTVTIPTTVKLGETAEITAENHKMEDGTIISVDFSRNTTDNGHSALVTADHKHSLEYKITLNDEEIHTGANVLTMYAGQENAKTAVLTFHEPETRPYPGKYSGTVGFTVSVESPYHAPSIEVTGSGSMDATGDTVVTEYLRNPEGNPCTFVYELVVDGETLFLSDPVAPGESLDGFTMSKSLPAGTYPAQMHIHTYALDTGAPMNSSVINFELRVKEG